MKKTAEVVIVGAGIMGCSAAYYLAQRGVDVLVLEEKEIAYGCSGRNGSGVRQSGRDRRELPIAMYGVQNIWPNLKEELGIDIEYKQSGNICWGKTEQDRIDLEVCVRNNSGMGLDYRMLYTNEDIRQIVPHVAPDVNSASWCPTDGHANSMRTTMAFYIRARQAGARFAIGEKVLRMEKHCGRIRRVITQNDVYEGESVILCAGIHSREIMRTVGLDVPMLPQYTEALVTEKLPFLFDQFISSADGLFYGQQQENGSFVFGGDSNYEIYDANYPTPITTSFSAPRICRAFLDYVPELRDVKIIRTWSGLLDMCWDGIPVISPVEEVPGLLIACAFTGHGFGLGPAVGQLLSQMVLGEPTAVDLKQLRYDRFRMPEHYWQDKGQPFLTVKH